MSPESRSAESRSPEPRSAESRSPEPQPSEPQPSEPQPSEPRSAQQRSAQQRSPRPRPVSPSAVVVGGSGFVGSACVTALRAAGWAARAEPAPRLGAAARTAAGLRAELDRQGPEVARLAAALAGADVVVNAAGLPIMTAGASDALFGANALLPAVLGAAAERAGVRRYVHLSSISVQGRQNPLDESMRHRAEEPYPVSRALGERLLDATAGPAAVILRLPSVLGADTAGQRALQRLARSPLCSTAGRGERPRPMALPVNVGAAVAFLAGYAGPMPRVVLQPGDGLTTGRLLELLGGRRPVRIPVPVATAVTGALRLLGRAPSGRVAARVGTLARGLELMWLGQAQVPSWLTAAGFVPPVDAAQPAIQPSAAPSAAPAAAPAAAPGTAAGTASGPAASSALRIGVLSHWYAPELAPNPAPTADRLAERGHDVKVLTGFPNYPTGRVYPGYRQRWGYRERLGAVTVRRVPLYASHDTNGLRRALNFLSFAATSSVAAARFLADRDVVYVYASPLTAAAAAAVLRRLRGVPYVLHVIDLWPESVLESGMAGGARTRRLLGRLLGAAAGRLYADAAHVVAVTPGIRRLLIERGVPADKVSVAYNWSPTEAVPRPAPDPALRERLGRPDRTLAVFAGNVGQMQDVETVVRAAALCQDDTPLDVAVVGAGTAFESTRRLAEELGAKNVRFFPRVDSSQMPPLYAASDYQLVTLKDRPLFHVTVPSKLGDALAAGCPVITTVPGDAAAMCDSGGFGFRCPPEDPQALAEVFRAACAEDEAARSRKRERAYAFYHDTLSMRAALRALEGRLTAAARTRQGAR